MIRTGCFCCLALVSLVGGLFAQDPKDGAPPAESQPAEQQVKSSAIVVSASSDGGPMEIQAFEMSSEGGFSALSAMPMMFGGMGAGGIQRESVNWLDDEDLLADLDVVPEQKDKLRQLRDDVQQRRKEFAKTVSELPAQKRMDFIREFSDLLKANIDEKVKDVLLPHQMKRLDQLRLQTQVRNAGVRALEGKQLSEMLNITDEQRAQLKKKRDEVEEKLRQKVEQLRKEAQDEMLSVLTPVQRDKLRELLGKDYEFKPKPFLPSMMTSPKPPASPAPRPQ